MGICAMRCIFELAAGTLYREIDITSLACPDEMTGLKTPVISLMWQSCPAKKKHAEAA